MKLLHPLLIASFLAIPSVAFSTDIKDLTAGSLKDYATNIDKKETVLTISGTMNAADFSYIQDNFNDLQTLDLSGVKILSYSGGRLPYTGLSSSADDALPAYSLTGLTSLTELKLPSELKSIDKGALSGTGLTTIVLPAGLENIGEYAFLRCNNLTKVSIPASVKSIGERAFAYCGNLTAVSIATNASLPTIPVGMFEASGVKNLNLKELAACSEIGPWALAECEGLLTLVLPENTRNIGEAALLGTTSIRTISLPASTDYIADNAMANMHGLIELDVSTVAKVPYLGENVWRNVVQKDVELITPDELINEFREADQWKEFNVIPLAESTIDIVNTSSNQNLLTVKRSGNQIIVEANETLGSVSVYNVSGHLVNRVTTDKSSTQFSIAGWPTGVYLIVSESGIAKVAI